MKHWHYLKYVLRHKWFVFVAGLKVGWPGFRWVWRLLIHDWTKFMPCEWFAYANSFYGGYGKNRPSEIVAAFNLAWNHHQKHNKHHWQYWLLTNDNDSPKHRPLPMPQIYLEEMVADWAGAGRAITGKWDVAKWYEKNRENILLHDHTRTQVEWLLTLYFDYKPENADCLVAK